MGDTCITAVTLLASTNEQIFLFVFTDGGWSWPAQCTHLLPNQTQQSVSFASCKLQMRLKSASWAEFHQELTKKSFKILKKKLSAPPMIEMVCFLWLNFSFALFVLKIFYIHIQVHLKKKYIVEKFIYFSNLLQAFNLSVWFRTLV